LFVAILILFMFLETQQFWAKLIGCCRQQSLAFDGGAEPD